MTTTKSLIVAYGLALLPVLVSSSPFMPGYFQRDLFSRDVITASTVKNELGPQLSSGSLIFGPDSALYPEATERWNTRITPDAQVVVQPAAEPDLAKIVKYCNDNSFEFLAGTFAGDVINQLWDQGFVTTTGSASCVGLLGAALGGGHARYEGLYGFFQDGIVHYNVALANGREIGVNETSYPDLLYALKGAGHNFVIVTSVVKKIYPPGSWYQKSYTWTQDQLETVFKALNKFHKSAKGTTPVRMGVKYGAIAIIPSISTTEAVLQWGFEYVGPAADAEKLLKPFNAIRAVQVSSREVTYPVVSGTDVAKCPGATRTISSVMTLEYNVTAERSLYNLFNKKIAQYPELTPGALLWHECYATAGMQAIPSASTAYPHREENHLMVFFSEVPEGSGLEGAAEAWARENRDLWNAGQPVVSRKYM